MLLTLLQANSETVYATEHFPGTTGAAWPGQWTTSQSAGSGGTATQDGAAAGQLNPGAGAGDWMKAVLTGMTALTDTDLYVEFTPQNQDANSHFNFQIASDGGSYSGNPGEMPNNGYTVNFAMGNTAATGAYDVWKVINSGGAGSGQIGGTTPTAITITAGTTYALRFQALGFVVRFKLWTAGASEPSAWTFTTTDSGTQPNAGKVVFTAGTNSGTITEPVLYRNVMVSAVASAPVVPQVLGGLQNTEHASTTSNTVTFALPTDATAPAAGDYYLMLLTALSPSANSAPTYPSGWMEVQATSYGTEGVHVAWGPATGTEAGTLSMPLATTIQVNAVLIWVRNANAPVFGTFESRATAGGTTVNIAPGITTTVANSRIIALSTERTTATTGETSPPALSGGGSGLTQVAYYQSDTSDLTTNYVATWLESAADTTPDLTLTYPNTQASNGVAVQVAFPPYSPTSAPALSGSGSLSILSTVQPVAHTEYAIDPGFELTSGSPWAYSTDFVQDTTFFRNGAASLKMIADVAARHVNVPGVTTLPVQTGDVWQFTSWLWVDASYNGTSGNGKFRLSDQSGSLVANTTWGTVSGKWILKTINYTVPSGVTAVTLGLYADHTAGTAWIDDVSAQLISRTAGNAGVDLSGSGTLGITSTTIAASFAATFSGSGTLATATTVAASSTPALSGSGTLTDSGTPNANVALALTGSGTLTDTATPNAIASTALSGSGTLAALATPNPRAAVSLSGSGVLSVSQASLTVAASLSGAGTLSTGTGLPNLLQSAALSGSGLLTASSVPNLQAALNLTGSGTLASASAISLTVTPAMSGSGVLSTAATIATSGTATLSGSGVLTTTRTATASGAATLSGTGALTTSQTVSTSSAVTLSGSGTLSSTQAPNPAIATAFSGSGILTTAVAPLAKASPALSGSGALTTAAGIPNAAVTPTLSGSGALTTAVGTPALLATAPFSGSGTLTTATTMTASGIATLSGSGVLAYATAGSSSSNPALSGSGTLATSGTPTIARTIALSGSGVLVASPTIAVTAAAISLSGSGTVSTAATPYLATTVSLSGSGTLGAVGANSSINTATLSGSGVLGATVIPATIGSLSLSGSGSLTVVPSISTSRSATLSGSGTIAATGIIGYSGTATLSGSGALTGNTSYVVSLTTALSGSGQMSAGGSQNLQPTVSLSGSGVLSGLPQNQVIAFPQFSGLGTLRVSAVQGWNAATTFSGTGTLNASAHPYRFAHFAILDTSNNAFRVVGERHGLAADGRNASVSAAGRNSGVSVTTKANPFIARTK